jgi:multiple antibiotic resistance protein
MFNKKKNYFEVFKEGDEKRNYPCWWSITVHDINWVSISGDSRIVPLAFPLLAGPGAITTVIISLQTYGWIVSIISIVFVVLATYVILHLENPISKILGRRGATVTTRVFAIFLAAIAVQYIVEGLRQLLVLQW